MVDGFQFILNRFPQSAVAERQIVNLDVRHNYKGVDPL